MNLSKVVVAISLSLTLASVHAQERKIVSGISSGKGTEFSPTISADGKTLIFESGNDRDKNWQLFETHLDKETGFWDYPVQIENICSKCDFLGGPSLSYDGNYLFFTAFIEDSTKSEDIFYATRLGENQWSHPVSIGAPINTDEFYEGFPSISPDGNTLYFMRVNAAHPFDNVSKESCYSLYFSKRTAAGAWGQPALLPAPINLGCEADPKIMADNHTLIFSSIREGGKGKFDMYQAVKQSDGSWSTPVALDFINSPENDQSPCISALGDEIFFHSNNDIYSMAIPEKLRQTINAVVEGRVLDGKKLAPVSATITVINLATNNSFVARNNSSDGEYSLVLNAGNKYRLIYDNDTFLSDTLEFDLTAQHKFELFRKNVLLTSSYQVAIKVVDKDLKKPISAWLNVINNDNSIFKDSVRTTDPSIALQFEWPRNYLVSSSKSNYTENTVDWNSNNLKKGSKVQLLVALEHVKAVFIPTAVNTLTRKNVKVKVSCQNKDNEELLIVNAGDSTYLRKGDRYQVSATSQEGYFFSSTEVIGGGSRLLEVQAMPLEVNAALTLNNINFESNSAALKSSSRFELDRVWELMKLNPKLKIELAAHTDDVGDEDFNLKLSNERALSAFEYLSKKGIAKNRMVPKGYGEIKPMVPNDSDESRMQNRRLELRVIKVS